jgi:AbrB family looped-hinge helix DNA binding protein
MSQATVSPKFQVVIPSEVRKALKLKPGQKVQVVSYEGRIEMIPIHPMRKIRGFLKGVQTTVPREGGRC